ncbi:RHS repeat-associated core domain-containing protein [Oscillospiraceae bacterium WX1]
MLISRTAGTTTLYYLYNGHGDVVNMTDSTGAIVMTYDYDAFGNATTITGNIANSYLYAGYQFDAESGLYYLNARYYDPVTARFMSTDTYLGSARDPLSLNLYTYCHNEPMMYTDPTGHGLFSNVLNFIGNTAKAVGSAVVSTVKTVGKAVATTVHAVGNTVKSVAKTVTHATKAVVTTVKKATNTVVTKASTAVTKVTNAGKAVVQKVTQVADTVSNAATTAVNAVGDALSSAGQFIYDNRVAIGIGALAVASIALGVVTFGASTAIGAAVLGSALIGGGIGLGVTEIGDLSDNGKIDTPASQYLGAYVGGAVTGAAMPFAAGAGSVAGGLAMYGASSAAGNMAEQLIGTGKIDMGEALLAGGIGAVTGGLLDYGLPALGSVAKSAAGKIGGVVKSSAGNVKNVVTDALDTFTGGAKAFLADNRGMVDLDVLFGGKSAGNTANVISNSSKDIKVIGRLDDTTVAKNWEGHDVLNDPNWTLAKNDEWVNAGINNKQDFYTASPMTEENLISTNPKYPGPTVYAREIDMLKNAGYVQKGDYFINPSNLK